MTLTLRIITAAILYLCISTTHPLYPIMHTNDVPICVLLRGIFDPKNLSDMVNCNRGIFLDNSINLE